MAHGYFRVVRALFLVTVVLVSTAVHPTPTAAQYIYLDANGDGIHTSADMVPATGPVTFDVWLVTDHYRNGTHALCDFDPTAAFTLRSYRIALQVGNGRVSFTDVTNRMESFDSPLAQQATDKTLLFGWSGGELSAGLYRLASVTIQIVQGAPRIGFTGFDQNLNLDTATAFGTDCAGNENDNLARLGEDWYDSDGLASSGPDDRPPAISDLSPMSVAETAVATQSISATDADGDPVTFFKASGPAYMTVATTSTAPGSGTGEITLAPGYSDAGGATGVVRAGDGILNTDRSFAITVQETNQPAVFEQPPDLYVVAGTSASLTLVYGDPDGTVWPVLVGGPPFVQVGGDQLLAQPALTQAAGSYLVSLSLGDLKSGGLAIDRTMHVIVLGSGHAPFLDPLRDMAVTQGERETQPVHAEDPDGDVLALTGLNFPARMTLETTSSDSGGATGQIVFAPEPSDAGAGLVTVRASDGLFSTERTFMATILRAVEGATSLLIHREPYDPRAPWQSIQFNKTEGSFSAVGNANDGVIVQFSPPAPPPDGTAWGPAVQLACLPAERPGCMSAPVYYSAFEFKPPLGKRLDLGTYPVTSATRDSTHATLKLANGCYSFQASTDGSFDVRQVAYATDGTLRSFWAVYRHHLLGATTSTTGFVRYNAALPAFVTPPSRFQGHVGTPIDLDLPIGGTDPVGRTVASDDLPAGATIESIAPDLARLHWTPGEDQVGLRDIHFVARAGSGEPDTTMMTVCVDLPGEYVTRVDVNRVELLATNRGFTASDQPGGQPGIFHPRGSGAPVADAIGVAIGALVAGETRFASGLAGDFAPGPIVNGATAPFEPRFRNYQIRPDAPHGYDWETWPRDLGAPTDASGLPLQIGDATAWSLSNDTRVHDAPYEPPRSSRPLGVEVRQTTWAYDALDPLGDVVLQRIQIRNAGSESLQEAYVGLSVSASTWEYAGDVGVLLRNSSACDTLAQLGYAFDDPATGEYRGEHNAVGVVMLQGPLVPRGDGALDTLGMNAFVYAVNGGAQGGYNALRGLNPDGSPIHEFFDPARPITRYVFTGDPIAGTGWVNRNQGGFFMMSAGPFDLAPGEEQSIVVATVAATGVSASDPLQDIRTAARAAWDAWRGGPSVPPPNHVPEISAVDSLATPAYEYLEFPVSASDPDGDPVALAKLSGPDEAEFVLQDTNHGRVAWYPREAAIGRAEFVFEARDTRGAAAQRTVVVNVRPPNRAPTAASGDGYRGLVGIPVAFDGRGSSDPDGDPLTYAWDFGDLVHAVGATPTHTYSRQADYAVTLEVSDGRLTDRDSTFASISAVDSASVSLVPGTNIIRLGNAKPFAWLSLEPLGGAFTVADVEIATITMSRTVTNGVASIPAVESKTTVGKDEDRDGIEEMVLAFGKEDLRSLMAELPGGVWSVPVTIGGSLAGGGRFLAPAVLVVDAGKHALAASVSPNPFNPEATLTLSTTRSGPARILVFDVAGRLVQRVAEIGNLPAGFHDFTISRGKGGAPLASGVYLYRVETVEGIVSGHLVVLK